MNEKSPERKEILEKAADFFRRASRDLPQKAAKTALGFLAAGALFPFLVDRPIVALSSLLGNASAGILSTWLMNYVQRDSRPKENEWIALVQQEIESNRGFRLAIEELIAKLGADELDQQARSVLGEEDQAWFIATLRQELAHYELRKIEVTEDGNVVGDGNYVVMFKENHYYYRDRPRYYKQEIHEAEIVIQHMEGDINYQPSAKRKKKR